MGAAGSDVAIESATITLMNNELDRLPFLLRLARQLRAVIMQNFSVGGLLIVGGVTLSAMAILSPILAAVIQVSGALCVAMNSARLIRQGEELETAQ
jgi:Cd2+/Zn2+-exporting ATPase